MTTNLSIRGACLLLGLVLSLLAIPAATMAAVFDDFEDGNLDGWLVGGRGGVGTTTMVVDRNGSKQAEIRQVQHFERTLSRDFTYVGTDMVSFDMQANATRHSSGSHIAEAYAGVTITFLSSLNASLGAFGLMAVSDASVLGPQDHMIDYDLHTYSLPMAELALIAGVGTGLVPSKMSLSYIASASCSLMGCSNSVVWFDNVSVVAAVPEPEIWAMMVVGLGLVGLAARRRKKNTA